MQQYSDIGNTVIQGWFNCGVEWILKTLWNASEMGKSLHYSCEQHSLEDKNDAFLSSTEQGIWQLFCSHTQ